MKDKIKTIDVKINRRKWYRGRGSHESRLLTGDKFRCCLGFACKSLGIKDEYLIDICVPANIDSRDKLQKLKDYCLISERVGYGNTELVEQLVTINDSTSTTDKHKEKIIAVKMKKMGFNVKFVN